MRNLYVFVAVMVLATEVLWGQDSPPVEKLETDADWIDDRFSKMDTGPFFCGTLNLPGGATPKGLVVKLDGGRAAMCFDTELLTWRAGWTGGFVKHDPARFGLIKPPGPEGEIAFANGPSPGWAGDDGSLGDPRSTKYGPLPETHGKWRGFHRVDGRVILSYEIGGVAVMELADCLPAGDRRVFVRTLQIAARRGPVSFRVHDGQQKVGIALSRTTPSGVMVDDQADGSLVVRLEAGEQPARITVALWPLGEGEAKDAPPPFSGETLDRIHRLDLRAAAVNTSLLGRHWGEPIVTQGSIGKPRDGFAIDTIGVPFDNPFNALMFLTAHDFFSNGDAAVCSAHGDVWLVRGIDEKLERVTWQRFATGLFQPLGLKIIGDKVHVLGRDRITVLHDLNGDGEADHYESFNDAAHVTENGHEYVAGLETDSAGNFYFLKCQSGGRTPHDGSLLRVPRDGRGVEVVATGFRNPVGLGIGPGDVVTVADQQGEWVPSTRVDIIKPGGFYGFVPTHHRTAPPETYDPPLCWLPQVVDNSAGGQVWLTGKQWGPLENQLVHLSYGRCTAMLLLRDEVGGLPQGAAVALPGRFQAGVMRGRIHPRDGHLYVTGLNGWQTAAVRDGCLQRLRHAGGPLRLPLAWSVHTNGLLLTFSEPLDRETAEDVGNFALTRWNYRWTSAYGSKDWSVIEPNKEGRDTVPVKSVRLADDGRTLFLELADVRPVMQMEIRYNLDDADGEPVRGSIYATINRPHPTYSP